MPRSTSAKPSTIAGSFARASPSTVTLSGTIAFKGLLIYAIDDAANRVGAWTVPSGYQIKACGGGAQSTMTQSDNTAKAAPANFTWTAPAAATGTVTFKALVVVSTTSYFDISGTSISEAIFRDGFE